MIENSIWFLDGTLTDTSLGQSGTEGNGNKKVLHILPNSKPHYQM